MAYEMKQGSLPDYGMPLLNEIGEKPARAPFPGFPGGPGGPGGPGPGPGGPASAAPAPTDDPRFPRSFARIPTYLIEDNTVKVGDTKYELEGTIGAESAENIRFTTDQPYINGIVVGGKSNYTIRDSYFRMDGHGVNDFDGIGAPVMVTDDATLNVENCYLETNGVIRPCVTCIGNAELHVTGCRIYGNSGPFPDYYDPSRPIMGPGMIEPPAGLFLGGTIRTTLACGTTRSYYKDSLIVSDSWAGLSTDMGHDLYLQADNCDIIIKRVGYGVYSDGGCNVVLNNCRFSTATHSGIFAGECMGEFNGCRLVSGKYNFMCHDLNGGVDSVAPINVRDSICQAEEACFYLKSDNVHSDVVGSTLMSPKYAIHAIVNDDPDARQKPADAVPYGNKFYVKGSTLKGDVVNDDDRSMSLLLEDSTVTGAIQNAYVKFTGNSSWYAPKDSLVALVDCTAVPAIDAPAGVTVTAIAGSGTTVSGTYDLLSGGRLAIG